ncbi:hypothetical protein GH714_011788 [Hevea brasiliensis]|uniref:OVATE domain-containing protein n=1 Tax=Hevea brasiliensis TaxID=3981 RepID=A0A6A6L9W8_HEVBR|nr:hypothetical protein GH714_011788 [Hevea brasiliensis]
MLCSLRIKLGKPIFIRAFRFRAQRNKTRKTLKRNRMSTALFSFFRSPKHSRQMDRVGELGSVSKEEHDRKFFPSPKLFQSPLTPAYIKASRVAMKEAFGNEDIEDACRSFENYLVEMIVEEGKVRDLTDVEELLYCWKNLKCPLFIDLVCRFYGELCKDLFSPEDDNDTDTAN